jgi:hypothetical protein
VYLNSRRIAFNAPSRPCAARGLSKQPLYIQCAEFCTINYISEPLVTMDEVQERSACQKQIDDMLERGVAKKLTSHADIPQLDIPCCSTKVLVMEWANEYFMDTLSVSW